MNGILNYLDTGETPQPLREAPPQLTQEQEAVQQFQQWDNKATATERANAWNETFPWGNEGMEDQLLGPLTDLLMPKAVRQTATALRESAPPTLTRLQKLKNWADGSDVKLVYHGDDRTIPRNLDEIRSRRSNLQTRGLYTTENPEHVKFWVPEDIQGSNVTPMWVKGDWLTGDDILPKSMLDEFGVKYKKADGDNVFVKDIFGGDTKPNEAFTQWLRNNGYTGIDIGTQNVIVNPFNVKSPFARDFDPLSPDMMKAAIPFSLMPQEEE